MADQGEWWQNFFDDFRPVFDVTSKKVSNSEARYVAKKLQLKKGMRFLDCPCGFGRISLPLAKMGIRVTGVDITQSYLDEFARKAHRSGVQVQLVNQDMRRITFKNEFHGAANLYTSIGYFEKESDNLLVIRKVFEALRPGGKFMLTTMNRDWIMVNFVPDNWFEVSGVTVLQSRDFDYSRSIMHDEWRFQKDGVEKVHLTTCRIYSYHELRSMFEKVGFIDIQGFGSRTDEPSGRKNRKIYMIATKPG